MDTRLLRLAYRLGSTTFHGLKQILRNLGGEYGEAAAYVEELTPRLKWELQRWARRQTLASLMDEEPSKVQPPASLRTALIEAIIEHGRLPVSDEELMSVLDFLREKSEDKGERR